MIYRKPSRGTQRICETRPGDISIHPSGELGKGIRADNILDPEWNPPNHIIFEVTLKDTPERGSEEWNRLRDTARESIHITLDEIGDSAIEPDFNGRSVICLT